MHNEINIKKYIIKNPDNELITFYKVPHTTALELIRNFRYEEHVYPLYGVDLKVFFFEDGKVLFEKTIDKSYYLLFDTKAQYDKFVGGKSYWKVFVDFNGSTVYSSFWLECDITNDLIKKSLKSDKSYEVSGNMRNYVLYYLPDGSVCFLTHRINDWYDGYWFNDYNQFKYIYNNVLNLQ